MSDVEIGQREHRRLAITANNSTWEMVEAERTPSDDDRALVESDLAVGP